MPSNDLFRQDYEPLGSPKRADNSPNDEQQTLKPPGKLKSDINESVDPTGLKKKTESKNNPIQSDERKSKSVGSDIVVSGDKESKKELKPKTKEQPEKEEPKLAEELSPSELIRFKKRQKREKTDHKLLTSDTWLLRRGHLLTYISLYLFSIMVFYRPYELFTKDPRFPDSFMHLEYLEGTAVYFAIVTLGIYLPVQYLTDGDFTIMSPEIKCLLGLTALSILSVAIARDRVLAFDTLTDEFIKAVLIFLVLVNVMRTRWRLLGMFWLSMSIGLYLSFSVLEDYQNGVLKLEGTRVAVDIGGLFGNPNDMALHLVTMLPIAIALGIATKNMLMRAVYFLMASFFAAGIVITSSRGGFLGLLAVFAVMAWKIGRKYRVRVTLLSLVVGLVGIVVAPGNYGIRILSIFFPGLDQYGSSTQRSALLKRSILVTIRNPWGIGIGNFPVVGQRNLVSHNAYTQVSSELGVLGLFLYLLFLIIPFRKLGAIERKLFAEERLGWTFYVSIGLQASIVGYMVSSFFLSVAYNWYIYYLIAYAVGFRRIYQIENNLEDEKKSGLFGNGRFGLRLGTG